MPFSSILENEKIILFISLLLLVSCSNNPSSTSSSTNPLNKLFFASDLEEKDLPKPKEKISSLDEMIYALDYLVFYQIDKKYHFISIIITQRLSITSIKNFLKLKSKFKSLMFIHLLSTIAYMSIIKSLLSMLFLNKLQQSLTAN